MHTRSREGTHGLAHSVQRRCLRGGTRHTDTSYLSSRVSELRIWAELHTHEDADGLRSYLLDNETMSNLQDLQTHQTPVSRSESPSLGLLVQTSNIRCDSTRPFLRAIAMSNRCVYDLVSMSFRQQKELSTACR